MGKQFAGGVKDRYLGNAPGKGGSHDHLLIVNSSHCLDDDTFRICAYIFFGRKPHYQIDYNDSG